MQQISWRFISDCVRIFKTRRETLNLIYAVKRSNCNCSIWLTDMIEDPGDYMDIDNRVCLSSILFD